MIHGLLKKLCGFIKEEESNSKDKEYNWLMITVISNEINSIIIGLIIFILIKIVKAK